MPCRRGRGRGHERERDRARSPPRRRHWPRRHPGKPPVVPVAGQSAGGAGEVSFGSREQLLSRNRSPSVSLSTLSHRKRPLKPPSTRAAHRERQRDRHMLRALTSPTAPVFGTGSVARRPGGRPTKPGRSQGGEDVSAGQPAHYRQSTICRTRTLRGPPCLPLRVRAISNPSPRPCFRADGEGRAPQPISTGRAGPPRPIVIEHNTRRDGRPALDRALYFRVRDRSGTSPARHSACAGRAPPTMPRRLPRP